MNGLIPACAGKTPSSRSSYRCFGAHPRVCGENVCDGSGQCRGPGSSPRVRGKQFQGNLFPPDVRLIPACAGKTSVGLYIPHVRTAHPRVCGENSPRCRRLSGRSGSSPRVRGKRFQLVRILEDQRLIPACAGKTLRTKRGHQKRWAHPRVCGENVSKRPRRYRLPGSSPRVRGKPARSALRRRSQRLIPACAGKTAVTRASLIIQTAHPRVCGENALRQVYSLVDEGSSPRVRGKLQGGQHGSF